MRTRSQSAMEYLTTYGWAVLVITVVVVILLKVGVFGGAPSQNVCLATSGFSCTAPSLAANGTVSTYFGQIGKSITITGLGCTKNSTGAGLSIQSIGSSVSLGSGQKAILGFPGCPIPSGAPIGTKFSGWIWIQYNIQNGPQAVVARVAQVTVTVSASGVSSGVLHTLSFKVSNNQAADTGSNFQTMISFNPSNAVYKSAEASDLGNIRFYSGLTELYSWCESGCTSGSSNAVFWIKIPSGISANSNVIISASFLANTIAYDGSYGGECPTCSITGYSTPPPPSFATSYDNSGSGSPSTSVSSSANVFICGAAMSYPGTPGDNISSENFYLNSSDHRVITAAGTAFGNTCSASTQFGTSLLLGEIGVYTPTPAYYQSFANGTDTGATSVTYAASSTNSLMVVVVACGASADFADNSNGGDCTNDGRGHVDGVPCSPTVSQQWFGDASIEIYACAVNSGSGTITAHNNAGAANMSLAVYIFATGASIPIKYAAYDNGASVFNFYDNFHGSSINSSKWNTATLPASSYAQSNGISPTSGTGMIWTASKYSTGLMEAYTSAFTGGSTAPIIGFEASSPLAGCTGTGLYYCSGYSLRNDGSGLQICAEFNNGNQNCAGTGTAHQTIGTYGLAWTSSGSQIGYFNYATLGGSQTFSNPAFTTSYLSLASYGGGAFTETWLRLRAYPPNGALPAVTQQGYS